MGTKNQRKIWVVNSRFLQASTAKNLPTAYV